MIVRLKSRRNRWGNVFDIIGREDSLALTGTQAVLFGRHNGNAQKMAH